MFDLPRPCENCPFRVVGGIRLHKGRAREIAEAQVENPGKTFPCHKTVPESYLQTDDEGNDVTGPWVKGMQYCAGALIFAAKQGRFNQMLQVMSRMRQWDPNQYPPEVTALVFNSTYDMIVAQLPPRATPAGRSANLGRRVKKTRGPQGR
jgi:hypothetical protein